MSSYSKDVFCPWFLHHKIPWFIPHHFQDWKKLVPSTWHAPIGCLDGLYGPMGFFLSPLTLVDFDIWVDHFQKLRKCVKHSFELLSHVCTTPFGFLCPQLACFDHIGQNRLPPDHLGLPPDHLGFVLTKLSNMYSNTLNKVPRLTP